MWRIVLFFAILGTAHSTCPFGFQLVHDECRGNYTRINTYSELAAKEAISDCQGILGQPIIIHNAEDQSFWSGRVAFSAYTVIGLVCNSSSKKWEWADGSAVDFKPPPGYYNSDLDDDCTTVYSGESWMMNSNSVGYWTHHVNHTSWTTDVFCTVPIRQPVPSSDGCDSFEDESEDGVCYQVTATAENWQDAQMICRSFGAEVASIHNDRENSFVRRLAVSKGAVSGVYLGAAIKDKSTEFAWIDGSEWDYANYYPGFPIAGLGDCLIMDTSGTTGEWVNVDCSSEMPVACIRQQHYKPPACSSGPWEEGQIIYSPGFPFDASTPCDFILSVDTGKKVKLEILLLEANPCCDHLVVYENYFGSNVITNLTGVITTPSYVTSSTNFMRVSWQPNGGVNVRGMMITYHSL